MRASAVRLLLSGLDTVETAYYFRPSLGCQLDFESIGVKREAMKASNDVIPCCLS